MKLLFVFIPLLCFFGAQGTESPEIQVLENGALKIGKNSYVSARAAQAYLEEHEANAELEKQQEEKNKITKTLNERMTQTHQDACQAREKVPFHAWYMPDWFLSSPVCDAKKFFYEKDNERNIAINKHYEHLYNIENVNVPLVYFPLGSDTVAVQKKMRLCEQAEQENSKKETVAKDRLPSELKEPAPVQVPKTELNQPQGQPIIKKRELKILPMNEIEQQIQGINGYTDIPYLIYCIEKQRGSTEVAKQKFFEYLVKRIFGVRKNSSSPKLEDCHKILFLYLCYYMVSNESKADGRHGFSQESIEKTRKAMDFCVDALFNEKSPEHTLRQSMHHAVSWACRIVGAQGASIADMVNSLVQEVEREVGYGQFGGYKQFSELATKNSFFAPRGIWHTLKTNVIYPLIDLPRQIKKQQATAKKLAAIKEKIEALSTSQTSPIIQCLNDDKGNPYYQISYEVGIEKKVSVQCNTYRYLDYASTIKDYFSLLAGPLFHLVSQNPSCIPTEVETNKFQEDFRAIEDAIGRDLIFEVNNGKKKQSSDISTLVRLLAPSFYSPTMIDRTQDKENNVLTRSTFKHIKWCIWDPSCPCRDEPFLKVLFLCCCFNQLADPVLAGKSLDEKIKATEKKLYDIIEARQEPDHQGEIAMEPIKQIVSSGLEVIRHNYGAIDEAIKTIEHNRFGCASACKKLLYYSKAMTYEKFDPATLWSSFVQKEQRKKGIIIGLTVTALVTAFGGYHYFIK